MTMRIDRLMEAPSEETAAFNAWLEATLAQFPATHEVPPAVTRAARARGESLFPLGGPLESAEWREVPGGAGRARVTSPEGAPRGVYVHIHGGGWTLGMPEGFDDMARNLAEEVGVAVVCPAYRLAPENPWPACADDCEAALRWVLDQFPGLPVFVGGDSAGAHLTTVTLNRLAAAGDRERIAGLVLIYGCFDLRMTPSMANWGPRNLILSTPSVDWFVDNLLAGDRALRADPQVSPLLAPVERYPPCLLQIGTADPLIDDTLFMAGRLAAAGVPNEVKVYPGGVHAFDLFTDRLAIAREARADRARWLAERLD